MGVALHIISSENELTEDEPSKNWKKLHLSGEDWNNNIVYMFISGSSYGLNQFFQKRKA